jgi:hypothetical protein
VKATISRPMILALADLHSTPLLISGPPEAAADPNYWIGIHTQRALLTRKLAEQRSLTSNVPACDGRPSGAWTKRTWLEITPAGSLVVAAYLLGAKHGRENAGAR